MFKLPSTVTKEIDLATIPYAIWPPQARSLAIAILGGGYRHKVLGDLFPLDKLISMIEQRQIPFDLDEL